MGENQAKSLLTLAGFDVTRVWELPNQYWPESYADLRKEYPWWLVKTQFGLIEIGWRKSVISIDWSDTGLLAIVTEDKTTKSETLVHAWTMPKALEYLTALRAAANKEPA